MKGKSFWVSLLALGLAAACESSSSSRDNDSDVAGQAGMAPDAGGQNGSGGTSGGSDTGNAKSGSGGASAGSSAMNTGGRTNDGGAVGEAGASASGGAFGEAGANTDGGTTADGGAVGEGGSDGASVVERLYISRILGGVLAASLRTSDGAPSLLPGAAINPGGHATAIAVDHSQRFVFVADENKHIDTYPIADDGTLPATPDSSVATAETLITLALDAKGRFAYAGTQPGKAIYTFKIAPATGVLSAVGEPMPVGDAPDHSAPAFIAADPSGRFVYVTLAGELGIRGYRVDQDSGALTELDDSPFAKTDLPVGDLVFGGAMVFKPSGDFLYTVGGGLNVFSINDASGALTLVDGSPFTLDVQSDPNAPNIAIDPQGRYLYATRFLLNNHISGFAIDDASGKLEPVPGSPFTGASPYSIAVDPSGHFVFVGDDAPQISVYSLSRANGALTKLPDSPFMFGGLEPKLVFATLP